ncbi:MAG: xanthine dehydrogenase family protein subunit M [Proteobacteria bacterium]|nr:xanthine dehydrogenase family protein subunit M [Pseudomonadota bacterium]
MKPVFMPRRIEEVWPIWERRPEAVLYAGGTDLFPSMRHGRPAPDAFICLESVSELKGVRDEGGSLVIGAGTTHAELLDDPLILEHAPILARALAVLGSPPIRHMGTIGGNVCTASPAGDTLPPLYLLGAEVEIQSVGGNRSLPMRDFILGPGRTALNSGEIVTGIRLDKAAPGCIHHFEKVGPRMALAIAVVSLAALLRVSDENRIESARLAWGSVGPTVVISDEVEAALIGRALTMHTLEGAAVLARRAVRPIDDIRAGADYRRLLAGNLILRLIEYARPAGSPGTSR